MKYIKFRERYIVSDTGLIWAIKKDGLKLKKQRITPKGYKTTNIDKVPLLVHRIVMEAFKGKSDLTVDHIDGNKENNNLNNLEYVTQTENAKRFHDKKVLWNGKEFRSFNDLSRYVGVANSTAWKNYSKGYKLKGHIIEVIK